MYIYVYIYNIYIYIFIGNIIYGEVYIYMYIYFIYILYTYIHKDFPTGVANMRGLFKI